MIRPFLMGAIFAGTNIRLVSVFVETRPYGAKNTDDYGFQICSLLVFDRSAEQIGANPPVYGFAPISLAPAFF
jgi:hypothetical protein